MNKEFIPYEQALELKELGYNIYHYQEELESFYSYLDGHLGDPGKDYFNEFVLAPLYQQAFRFFRDKYNLKGGIEYIGGMKPKTTWWDIYVIGHFNIEYKKMTMKYQPYEEAEFALLKKLIEIVKDYGKDQ